MVYGDEPMAEDQTWILYFMRLMPIARESISFIFSSSF